MKFMIAFFTLFSSTVFASSFPTGNYECTYNNDMGILKSKVTITTLSLNGMEVPFVEMTVFYNYAPAMTVKAVAGLTTFENSPVVVLSIPGTDTADGVVRIKFNNGKMVQAYRTCN